MAMISTASRAGPLAVAGMWPGRPLPSVLQLAALLAALIAFGLVLYPPMAFAQIFPSHAEPARPPLRIAVFVSSRTDQCYDNGYVAATAALARAEENRINSGGGIAGRPVKVTLYDDVRDAARTIANMRAVLDDPETLAVIGLSGSDRAKAVFDELGKDIRARRIPFLSGISVNGIFADYPNVFTTQATQDDERLPVLTAFVRRMGFSRTAFVGYAEAVFSKALGDGLARASSDRPLIADHRLGGSGDELDSGEVAAMVADLQAKQPDLLVVGMGGARAAKVIADLVAAGVTPALFVTGRIDALPAELTSRYPNAIYQLAWDNLPETDNDRLRRMVENEPPENWSFEGKKVPEAPGWANGKCETRPLLAEPDPLTEGNLRAIGVGSIAADMIALVAKAAGGAKADADVSSLRRRVVQQINTSYAAGRGMFKGRYDNWSFNPKTRSASRTPFVVILPQGLGRTQLAPIQFVRVRDGALQAIETLYLDIDLIRASHVEDNEQTFFAEFYLSMRNGVANSIEQIDFTNAYVDPRTNGRQLAIERLHDGGSSGAWPVGMKVYKVSGRFTFEPDLTNYPFDRQRFSIDIQPKRGDAPFIVQPPPLSLRDKVAGTDGWDMQKQYVGVDEDFVPLVDAYTHYPSVVPFYKASFVWLMKRQTTDYYLRVVVPLAFILIVAYLSIFIPISHFEAIVTIQVTALLSAVALYLSLPKLESDAATVSDRIFVFNYMMVSLMIVISIMRMNGVVTRRRWIGSLLWALHVVAMPVMIAAFGWTIYELSAGL
jgi:hypothetical protein